VIHTLDARVKFLLAIGFILTTSLTPGERWPVFILLLAVILSVEVLSELGILFVWRRALLALPFVLAALPLLFTTTGNTLFEFYMGKWHLMASWEGLERFASIAMKSWLSVQAAILLASCTPFPELLAAMRAVRIPRLLVAIFGLMWRYLFVLVDEAMRLMRARAARSSTSDQTATRPGRDIAWRARVTGGMAGNLFLRAFGGSDRIYMAMLARGYDGEIRSTPLYPLTAQERLVLTVGFLILLLLLTLAYLL